MTDQRKKVHIVNTNKGIAKVCWDEMSAEVVRNTEAEKPGIHAWVETHVVVGGKVVIAHDES